MVVESNHVGHDIRFTAGPRAVRDYPSAVSWCARPDSNREALGSQPSGYTVVPSTRARWWPWSESNRHAVRHPVLRRARLPVSPQGRKGWRRRQGSNLHPRKGRSFSRRETLPTVHASARLLRSGIVGGRTTRRERPCQLHHSARINSSGAIAPNWIDTIEVSNARAESSQTCCALSTKKMAGQENSCRPVSYLMMR